MVSIKSHSNIQINEVRKPQNIDEIIAERMQEEMAKRPEQPADEEIERLRRELAEREEAGQEREERERRMDEICYNKTAGGRGRRLIHV